jgi:hypothetical protein
MRPLLAAVALLIAVADKGPTPPAGPAVTIPIEQCDSFSNGAAQYCMKTFAIETNDFEGVDEGGRKFTKFLCTTAGMFALNACVNGNVKLHQTPDEDYCVDVASNFAASLTIACQAIADESKDKNSPEDTKALVQGCEEVALKEMRVVIPRCLWQREAEKTGKNPPVPDDVKKDPRPPTKPELPPFKESSETI